MSVRRAPAGSRARSLVTAVPTLPLAPTMAMCGRAARSRHAGEQHPDLVLDDRGGEGVAVRHRDVGALAQRGAAGGDRRGEGAEADDVRAERDGAVDRRLTRRLPPSTSESRCRAPNGTSTTWPTRSPPICTPAIVTGGSGRRRSAVS